MKERERERERNENKIYIFFKRSRRARNRKGFKIERITQPSRSRPRSPTGLFPRSRGEARKRVRPSRVRWLVVTHEIIEGCATRSRRRRSSQGSHGSQNTGRRAKRDGQIGWPAHGCTPRLLFTTPATPDNRPPATRSTREIGRVNPRDPREREKRAATWWSAEDGQVDDDGRREAFL